MTALEIHARIEAILAEQYQDGERRQKEEAALWGGCGGDVKRAVFYAQDAVRKPRRDEQAGEYVQAIITGIESQTACYREIEHDPDGYGSGTFKEILASLRAIEAIYYPEQTTAFTQQIAPKDSEFTEDKQKVNSGLSNRASTFISIAIFVIVVFILAQRRL
ncbi:MAG: hypothetical protein GJ680_01320 [Alteromonadaceae bacterium]|nr:hypothetical protein [Alteromonadaceae bacterium]